MSFQTPTTSQWINEIFELQQRPDTPTTRGMVSKASLHVDWDKCLKRGLIKPKGSMNAYHVFEFADSQWLNTPSVNDARLFKLTDRTDPVIEFILENFEICCTREELFEQGVMPTYARVCEFMQFPRIHRNFDFKTFGSRLIADEPIPEWMVHNLTNFVTLTEFNQPFATTALPTMLSCVEAAKCLENTKGLDHELRRHLAMGLDNVLHVGQGLSEDTFNAHMEEFEKIRSALKSHTWTGSVEATYFDKIISTHEDACNVVQKEILRRKMEIAFNRAIEAKTTFEIAEDTAIKASEEYSAFMKKVDTDNV